MSLITNVEPLKWDGSTLTRRTLGCKKTFLACGMMRKKTKKCQVSIIFWTVIAKFHAQNASWKPHKKFLYTAVIFLVSREKHCLLLHIIVCACPRKSFRKAQKMSSYVGKNHSLQVPKTFCALRTKRFLREELNFCCFFHVCFFVLSKYVVITSLLGS